ncbi:hypothetical protein HU200_041343 [Digitaria exilis]|uniref:Sulfotransferase n=1 Tax=Digitaria exilis TaxID=1010633 RepID=A0A835B742_9POAL|nr:hypothetical protein HU200_041343 [Digitaria exilis]
MPLFRLHGFWLTQQRAESVKLVHAQFKPRRDDVFLVTYPKSGTTWLKALVFTVLNRSVHPVSDAGHPLLSHNPHGLVPFLEYPDRTMYPVMELEELPSPRLLSTHVPPVLLPSGISTLGCRVVYLCREPKVVLVSTWHYMNKRGRECWSGGGGGAWHYMNKVYRDCFTEFDRAFELFCEGVSLYGPIWDHYLGYWKQSVAEPNRVLFLKYDEMMADTGNHVKRLAEFFGDPFTVEEESSGIVQDIVKLCSFENLKKMPVNCSGVTNPIDGLAIENSVFFRTGKVRDWENHMTEETAKKLDRIIEEKLGGCGLTF